MKKHLLIAIMLLVGSMSFAQKSELKAAEKALKKENFSDAKTALQSAEDLISNADSKYKAMFYFLKGKIFYANGTGSDADINTAVESFDMVKKIESNSDGKYSIQVGEIKQDMINHFLIKANTGLESKDYLASSSGFEKAYRISLKDTSFLYNAAITAVKAKDYDKALIYYEELNQLGYQGLQMEYFAINKETGKKEPFTNKTLRDFSVNSGSHLKPSEKATGSRASEIIKNMAIIYKNNGQDKKAIEAYQQARKTDPDNLELILAEANLHFKLDNLDEFSKLIKIATEKDPNNAELQFNLGVLAANSGDVEIAKAYYNKAIELDPNYVNANINMAVLILGSDKEIMKKMNALGSSAADDKKYDELQEQRKVMYRTAIPYLTKAMELDNKNINAIRTLKSIYSSLGETDKYKEMKAKLTELETDN